MLEDLSNPDNKQTETGGAIRGEVIDTRIVPFTRKLFTKLPDYVQGIKRVPSKGTNVDVKA
ncbi:MAG: hypothetical protein ABSE17_02185 [Candidatus Levyibacteriota bacterium]|jgi:hypothetical protein